MTIFLQFFRLSASFCPGAACPAVGPQAAQIPRQVGIAAPDMSGIQHPHAAPVPHTKARQHQCCPAPQVWCSHSGTMQFCAAAKVQQPSLAAGISPQGGKALRTGKAVLEQAVIKCGMLPPPPAAPLQPAGQYLWQGQGKQPLQVPDRRAALYPDPA